MDRISTGVDALDDILEGGFPSGGTYLIVGRPGTGKTILANQMIFSNAAGEDKGIYLTTMAEPQIKVLKFQQEFEFFDVSKFQQDVIYQDLGSTLRKNGAKQALVLIDQLLKKHHPTLMVIDTIKTISDMLSLTEFREFVLDLSLKLATWDCTVLLLGEYSEEDVEMRPESAIADGIIYLYGSEEKQRQKRYLRILKMRGTRHPGGENYFSITAKGIEVFPRINPKVVNQEYHPNSERISTGIEGLDKITNGGLQQGSTTLLSGSSGTCKTLLALHFVFAALIKGERAVYVSFEENPLQLLNGAEGIGLNLRPYWAKGHLQLLHVSPIELDVDEHIHLIQKTVRDSKASRLVIDSISSFEIGMVDKIKYTDYIWALTDYFKTQGVSVLLTHEIHDSYCVSELTKHGISFVADNLIMLRFAEKDLELKRFIRVIKMRNGKHATTLHELKFTDDRLIIS